MYCSIVNVLLKYVILVWLGHLIKIMINKLYCPRKQLPNGIGHLSCYLDQDLIGSLLMFGVLDVLLPNYLLEGHSLLVILRLISFRKSCNLLEMLLNKIQMLLTLQLLNNLLLKLKLKRNLFDNIFLVQIPIFGFY